jgi:hypothetical protein
VTVNNARRLFFWPLKTQNTARDTAKWNTGFVELIQESLSRGTPDDA